MATGALIAVIVSSVTPAIVMACIGPKRMKQQNEEFRRRRAAKRAEREAAAAGLFS